MSLESMREQDFPHYKELVKASVKTSLYANWSISWRRVQVFVIETANNTYVWRDS